MSKLEYIENVHKKVRDHIITAQALQATILYIFLYQLVGPKNLPVALGLGFVILTAVSKLSALLFATLTPHQLVIFVLVRLRDKMITIVQMAKPTSSPAEVM